MVPNDRLTDLYQLPSLPAVAPFGPTSPQPGSPGTVSIRDLPRRTVAALAAGALVVAGTVTGVVVAHQTSGDTHAQQAAERDHGEEGDGDSAEEREHERHNAAGEAGEESETLHTAFDQFRGARQLGLLTDPGVYSDAYAALDRDAVLGRCLAGGDDGAVQQRRRPLPRPGLVQQRWRRELRHRPHRRPRHRPGAPRHLRRRRAGRRLPVAERRHATGCRSPTRSSTWPPATCG